MKIIFSRKGFDSASGGCPSPILSDGQLIPLPIPDNRVNLRYTDLKHPAINYSHLVEQLTKGKIQRHRGAHLDPDLSAHTLPRPSQWRPVFGQYGAAQAHLRNQQVNIGDVFVFFGLFRRTVVEKGLISWNRSSHPQHVLWGYLQVEQIISLTDASIRAQPWLRYHPHCQFQAPKNTLYVARKQLRLAATEYPLPGAGAFYQLFDQLRLTAPGSDKVSQWQLPHWMFPDQGKPPLSYHTDVKRWHRNRHNTSLRAVARGQEFVLDSNHYPESIPWLYQLITRGMNR